MLVTMLALIVVLGVLIFVHEAGHFIAAKWAGIYVHRFSLGLGSPIPWLTFKRGETEYSISWLPLGGYVKMASREEDVTSSRAGGRARRGAGAPGSGLRGQAGLEADGRDPGRRHHERAVRLARVHLPGGEERPPDRPDDHRGPGDRRRWCRPAGRPCATFRWARGSSPINGRPVNSWNDVQRGHRELAGVGGAARAGRRPHRDPADPPGCAGGAPQGGPGAPAVPARGDRPGAAGPTGGAGWTARRATRSSRSATVPIAQWYDVLEVLQANTGTPLTMTVAGDSGRRTLNCSREVETIEGLDGKPRKVGRVGISVALDTRFERAGSRPGIQGGLVAQPSSSSTQIVRTVRGLFTGRISRREVGGPIMIGQLAGESARMGLDPSSPSWPSSQSTWPC